MLELVAEMSANHLGDIDRAMAIVDAAARAGATHVKVQVWQPDSMCVDRTYTLKAGPWSGRKLFELYREAWTPWEWLPDLFGHARSLGLTPFGAAFDRPSVDYLESLGVDRHKVASFELVDLPLIRHMATKGRPIILSSGMADKLEVAAAYRAASPCQRMVLVCASEYPARPSAMQLREKMRNLTVGDWGLSDHTPGTAVSVAAVALGATYIEKHLTLERGHGLDGGFSLEPEEFHKLVGDCKTAYAAIHGTDTDHASKALRRSMWTISPIAKGDALILGKNVATARPAIGVPPFDPNGAPAKHSIEAFQPLTGDCL